MIRYNLLLLLVLLGTVSLKAQNYHGIQGSPYAGSLGVHNNPASILMAPYKWDLTILGIQGKSSTNFFTINNYSLLSNPYKSSYSIDGGDYKRFSNLSINLNLLNARIALGRQAAIAFGVNIKSYSNASSSPYNYEDTLLTTGDFFKINQPERVYSARINSSSWAEIYATYSRTIVDNDAERLNAGITVKVNKGLSGAVVRLENGGYSQSADRRYSITGGYLEYLYSANLDHWQKQNGTGTNISNLLRYSNGGISVDAGVEYMVKHRELVNFDDGDNYYDYEWKFGLSLLDAGFTKFHSGDKSRGVSNIYPTVTSADLDNKFDSTITSLKIFNDSLATIAGNFAAINGVYNMINPMRLVVNIDRFVTRNVYVNAELSLNIPDAWVKKWRNVKEMNLLTVTPRWETRRFGLYLPIQYTNTNRFWIGGAFKAGPLLLGIHNWASLFSKTSVQNGGGYIALIIRSPENLSKKQDRRLDCPKP